MTIPNENKTIARKVAEIFGTKSTVSRYWDDNKHSHVDILVCENSPQNGVNSYSTVSLSNHEIGEVDSLPLGVELVAACGNDFVHMPNVVATCAFNIINSGYITKPGIVFPDVFAMYDPKLSMKHALFVPPFLWDKNFETISFENRIVAWLMIVPISDTEFSFLEENGFEALDKLFDEKQIDVFNLDRKPVI